MSQLEDKVRTCLVACKTIPIQLVIRIRCGVVVVIIVSFLLYFF